MSIDMFFGDLNRFINANPETNFGGFEYGAASQGKTSFANLKDGDTIMVDSDEGTWTY